MKRAFPVRWLAATALLAALAGARGAEVYVHYEQFKWTEDDVDGRRLVTEDGPLYGVGVRATHPLGPSVELAGRLEGFMGEVDYDGETQAGDQARSTTEYYGLEAELDGRLPFAAADRLRLAPFLGLGARPWLRRLDSSPRDSNGYDEEWLSIYGRAGLRAEWTATANARFFAQAAARRPFSTTTRVSLSFDDGDQDLSLEPKSEWSADAEVGAEIGDARISLFCEQIAFGRSDSESVPPFEIFQPESEGRLVGLRVGLEF
jgi:hypothetical protein